MKKLFIIAAVAMVGMASCSKENGAVEPKGSGNVEITLLDGNAAATRADLTTYPDGDPVVGSAAENKVTQIEIFVFNNDGSALDTETINGTATAPAVAEPGYINIDMTTATLPYKTQVKMGEGTNKDIIVVANANLGATAGTTFDAVMQKIEDAQLGGQGNVAIVPTAGFLMTGYTLTAAVASGDDNKIAIALDRAVARVEYPTAKDSDLNLAGNQVEVDFELEDYQELYGDDFEEANIEDLGDLTFELNGFAVINGLKQSSVGFVGNKYTADGTAGTLDDDIYSVNDKPLYSPKYEPEDEVAWNLWTETVTTDGTPVVGAFVTARGGRIESNSETTTAAAEWNGGYSGNNNGDGAFFTDTDDVVYVYESKPDWITTSGLSGYDTDGVIALIVKGTITAEEEEAPQIRYWRVDVRSEDSYHILRNSSYHTAINVIMTPGYKTPQEAEEERPVIPIDGEVSAEFTISVSPWIHSEVGNGIL